MDSTRGLPHPRRNRHLFARYHGSEEGGSGSSAERKAGCCWTFGFLISHEINNPLEAVTNLLFLARSSTETWEVHGYLDQADQELRRVSIIANQTLRFRKQNAEPQPIHSSELFAGVLSLLEGKIKNAGVIVERRDRAHRQSRCSKETSGRFWVT